MKTQHLLILILTSFLSTTAYGQVTVDITKITCRQFLIGKVISTKSMAIWFSGYYNGKHDVTLINPAAIEGNADKVKDACRLKQDGTLMKTIETTLGVK